MDGHRKAGRYALEPLLKVFGWEADALTGELSRLRGLVEEQEQRVSRLVLDMREAERELRAMQEEGVIRLEKKERDDLYLRHQGGLLHGGRAELSRLQSLHDRVAAQLAEARKSMKLLEKHRERKKAREREADARLDLKEADWAWLIRTGGRQAP